MILTKTLILAMLAIQAEQAAKPTDLKDQQIAWMQKKITLLEEKIKAISLYYSADEQLIQLEQQKPQTPPEKPNK